MKAAVLDPHDRLKVVDLPDPEFGPREVLVRVAAAGVQGGDVLRSGRGPSDEVPSIVGMQAAGVVVAVGNEVTSFSRGQRVVAFLWSGSHAELAVAAETHVYAVPDVMDLSVAACVPVEFGTADDCLFEFGGLRPGETVLIHAATGGVGLAAVQLAKAAGATVLGSVSSDAKLAKLSSYDLDHVVNHRDQDVLRVVHEVTDGRGVDLVVDPVGGRTLEVSIAVLAYRGRVSWVGRAGRETHVPDTSALMGNNASLHGVMFGAEMTRNPGRTRPLVDGLLRRVADGELSVLLDREFPLVDAAAAHRYVESRAALGRVLVVP